MFPLATDDGPPARVRRGAAQKQFAFVLGPFVAVQQRPVDT